MKAPLQVVPSFGKWALRRAGGARAIRLYSTRQAAVDAGVRKARREGVVLHIFDRSGRVQRRVARWMHGTPERRKRIRDAVQAVVRDQECSKAKKVARGEAISQRRRAE